MQKDNHKDFELKKQFIQMQRSHKFFNNFMAQAGIAQIELDINLKVVQWNKAAHELFCYSYGEAYGCFLSEIVALKNSERILNDFLYNALTINSSDGHTFENITSRDDKITCTWYYSHSLDNNDKITGLYLIAQDITEKIKTQEKTKKLDQQMKELYGFAPIGIYQVNSEWQFISVNHEMAWMFGYETSSTLLKKMSDIATQMFADTKDAEQFFFNLLEAEQVNAFRCKLKKKNGSTFWGSSYAKVIRNGNGRLNGFYGFLMDISENVRTEKKLKQLNKELKRLSTMDGLTKIPNRRRFDEYLQSEYKRAIREKTTISVILCDIDFFKKYNDTYGHQAGDDTLRQVAQCIAKITKRPADLTARYGGEEFVAVLPNTNFQNTFKIAEEMRKAVQELRIIHSASEVNEYVSISLGVASILPNDTSDTPEQLVELADNGLYKAKEIGRNIVTSV